MLAWAGFASARLPPAKMAAVPDVAAILLDALGTLLRLDPPAPRLRAELRRRFGAEVSEREAAHAFALEIEHYRARLQDGRDEASLRALQGECADVLWEALPRAPRAPRGVRATVLLSCLHFEAFPDAVPALQRVRTAGRRAIVVSNWDVSLHAVLARTGLAGWLDGVVTSAEVGVAKPGSRPFLEALRMAGAAACEGVHVGDSLREDVAGARAAGLRAVWLDREGAAGDLAPGVPRISSLDGLEGVLAR